MEIDTKRFTVMIVGLAVAIILVSGLMIPVISSLGSGGGGGHFDTSITYNNVSNDLSDIGVTIPEGYAYKSYVQGKDTIPSDIIFTLESITELCNSIAIDPSKYDYIYDLNIIEGMTGFGSGQFVIYEDSNLESYDFKVNMPNLDDSVSLTDITAFNMVIHPDYSMTYSITVTGQPSPVTTEGSGMVDIITYLDQTDGGYSISYDTSDDLSPLYVGAGSVVNGGWDITLSRSSEPFVNMILYEKIIVDESMIENGEVTATGTYTDSNNVEHEATVIIPLQDTDTGGIKNVYRWDVRFIIDGQNKSSFNWDIVCASEHPYVEGGSGSNISPALMTMISVIPLITVIGILIGAVGYLRMKD